MLLSIGGASENLNASTYRLKRVCCIEESLDNRYEVRAFDLDLELRPSEILRGQSRIFFVVFGLERFQRPRSNHTHVLC